MQVEKKYITTSAKETQELGQKFALRLRSGQVAKHATVVALFGNLGGGKTTFLQGLAKELGIKEKILSPTFVILKHFEIVNSEFQNFYHIDCYRLKNKKDILELGWKEIIKNPENIIAIEWPEKIKKVLPKNIIKIEFKFIDDKIREIFFKI